jgi:hypothetical protein
LCFQKKEWSPDLDPELVEGLGCNFVLFQRPICNTAAAFNNIYTKNFKEHEQHARLDINTLRAATGSRDIKHMGAKHKGEKKFNPPLTAN